MAKSTAKTGRFSWLMKVLTILCLLSLLFAYLCPYIHPETFWLLPFFGLAYPVIICCTILLLLYWAFLRSRWFFTVLGVILLGGNLHFRTLAVTFSPPLAGEADSTWRVMSYNVRLFDVYNESKTERLASRNAIISYIDKMQPDVLCFQEFYHQDAPTSFSTKDTLIRLLKIKDYHERYSHKLNGRQNFGICMLSRYPMIDKGNVTFESGQTDNYCVYADIVKGEDTIRFYNIHLQSIKLQKNDYAMFGEENKQAGEKESTFSLLMEKLRIAYPKRADQARKVVEHMESSPYPVIICGDFNDTPLSYVYNQFNKLLTDSFRESSRGIGITYVGRVPAGRIDYIFHTPDLAAHNFIIQKKAHSDHRAVFCEIWKPVPAE